MLGWLTFRAHRYSTHCSNTHTHRDNREKHHHLTLREQFSKTDGVNRSWVQILLQLNSPAVVVSDVSF